MGKKQLIFEEDDGDFEEKNVQSDISEPFFHDNKHDEWDFDVFRIENQKKTVQSKKDNARPSRLSKTKVEQGKDVMKETLLQNARQEISEQVISQSQDQTQKWQPSMKKGDTKKSRKKKTRNDEYFIEEQQQSQSEEKQQKNEKQTSKRKSKGKKMQRIRTRRCYVVFLKASLSQNTNIKDWDKFAKFVGWEDTIQQLKLKYQKILELLYRNYPYGKTTERQLIEFWVNKWQKKSPITNFIDHLMPKVKQKPSNKLLSLIEAEIQARMKEVKRLTNQGKRLEREIKFTEKFLNFEIK